MLNFIIYEDNNNNCNTYKEIINNIMMGTERGYKIYEFCKYEENLEEKLSQIEGKKIYLFDIEVPGKNGIDLARTLRNKKDWTSQIIIITSHEQYKNTGFISKILALNFIQKDIYLEKNLKESIILAFDVLNTTQSLKYKYNGEIYSIPYTDIFFIEKRLNDNYCSIITMRNNYTIKETINNLEKKLKSNYFVKTHRSCIVNIKNIKTIDLKKHTINFENKKTDLLARNYKKGLEKRILDD